VSLTFGEAMAFAGHGILLPCVGGDAAFHALRVAVLAPQSARAAAAHITLAHPRNPRAPGNHLTTTRRLPASFDVTFPTLALIEQRGDAPWAVIWSRELHAVQLDRPVR
jgi:hypothetical protein